MSVQSKKLRLGRRSKILIALIFIFISAYLIPDQLVIPVQGASASDWHAQTFWFEPWGRSGVHKGIDIFAAKATPLVSSGKGLVLYTGEIEMGGQIVVVLGPKWRIHYYAHLDSISTTSWQLVSAGEVIGAVGDSGNAQGKPPHLHYSIVTLLPYIWRVDGATQGWKKMFFLNPGELLQAEP